MKVILLSILLSMTSKFMDCENNIHDESGIDYDNNTYYDNDINYDNDMDNEDIFSLQHKVYE